MSFQNRPPRHCSSGRKPLLFATAMTTAAGLAAAAHAQTLVESDTSTATVSEVIVTASKRAEDVQKVAAFVSVVGGPALVANKIENVYQLKGYLPNFDVTESAGRSSEIISIRQVYTSNGFFALGTTSPVATYEDEIYHNSNFLRSDPYYDIERVEVVAGPGGTLWGHNTTGGAVNVITKKPTDQFGGYASLSYGSYNELDFEGAVGGSLIADKLSARLSFTRLSADGWAHNLYDGKQYGGYTDAAERLQLLWTPTDNLSFLLKLHARDLTADSTPYSHTGIGPGGLDLYGYTGAGLPWNVVNSNTPNAVDNSQNRGAVLTMDWNLNFATLTMLASYDKGNGEYRFDDDGSPLDIETSHYTAGGEQGNFEIRLTSKSDQNLTWIVGANAFNDTVYGAQQYYSLLLDPDIGGGPYALSVDYWQRTQDVAIYGSGTWHTSPKWSVTVGGRYTVEWLRDRLKNGQYLINPVAPEQASASAEPFIPLVTQNATQRSSEPTGDATLQYQPTSAFNLYAKISRGYRGGGFNPTTFSVGTVLQPEHVWAYEVGGKTKWFDGRLTVNASGFMYNFNNLQIFTATSNLFNMTNAGRGEYRGLDASVAFNPTPNVNIALAYGFVHKEAYGFSTTGPDNNVYEITKDNSGRNFTTLNVSGSYIVDVLGKGSVTFYGDLYYHPKSFGYAVYLSDPLYASVYPNSYVVGNARVSYKMRGAPLEVALWVKNIANTHAIVNVVPIPYYQLNEGTLTDPRRFGVTLSATF